MGRHAIALNPDGVPAWMAQRAARLARDGASVSAIAAALNCKPDLVHRLLRQRATFERCPNCGGRVVPPCRACSQRAAAT